jgi:hypothetical protein
MGISDEKKSKYQLCKPEENEDFRFPSSTADSDRVRSFWWSEPQLSLPPDPTDELSSLLRPSPSTRDDEDVAADPETREALPAEKKFPVESFVQHFSKK